MAVLLDNFIGASTQMELEERLRLTELKAREQQMRNPLESLLMKIAKEFSDSEDLSERLQKLYQVRNHRFSQSVDLVLDERLAARVYLTVLASVDVQEELACNGLWFLYRRRNK